MANKEKDVKPIISKATQRRQNIIKHNIEVAHKASDPVAEEDSEVLAPVPSEAPIGDAPAPPPPTKEKKVANEAPKRPVAKKTARKTSKKK